MIARIERTVGTVRTDRWLVAEVILLLVLLASWLVAVDATDRSLDELPAGSRALRLGFYATDDRLGLAAILGAAAVLAVALRHRWPVGAFGLVSALVLVIEWRFPLVTTAQFATELMLVVSAFWAFWRTPRHLVPLAGAGLVVAALTTLPLYRVNRNLMSQSGLAASDLSSASQTAVMILLMAATVGAALLVRRFGRQAATLAAQNVELDQQRAATARAAVIDERLRIARELHDVVAHHVTTMTIHAGAARQVGAADPQVTNQSLHQIENAGRTAVAELQRLLGLLRSQDDPTAGPTIGGEGSGPDGSPAGTDRAPVPSLRRLDHLAATLGDHLTVEVTISGDLDLVPTSVDVSGYRIVQEALTNVMKHSAAGRATVEVRVESTEAVLRITDPGPLAPDAGSGTGHGLLGMRERAALHGGTVEMGRGDDDGWLVSAQLPYDRSVM